MAIRFHPLQACRSYVRFAMGCYHHNILVTDMLERLMVHQLAVWDEEAASERQVLLSSPEQRLCLALKQEMT